MGEGDALEHLPVTVQLLIELGFIIVAGIVSRFGYRPRPPSDDSMQIVGGALADRSSMQALTQAVNRVAEAVEAHNTREDQLRHDEGVRRQAIDDMHRGRKLT